MVNLITCKKGLELHFGVDDELNVSMMTAGK